MNNLRDIKPGVNYPRMVIITETDGMVVNFYLQSYIVGMYCAIHFPDRDMPVQRGDNNNKTFVRELKATIKSAIKRGAKVEIGALWPVKEATL